MQHFTVSLTLCAAYMLSCIQCQTQQPIRAQAEEFKKKAKEDIAVHTEKPKVNNMVTGPLFDHRHVILPGLSYLDRLKSQQRRSRVRPHIHATYARPHLLYKNRRMNPIRNHLEVKNDRKMMKPKGMFKKPSHFLRAFKMD